MSPNSLSDTALPAHLKRYIVAQDYGRYTPVDQAVWRYIMRQLTTFLSVHAHSCYMQGLEQTGIEIDRIPRIEEMSKKLEKFGWRAVPVSGFIPPAAFMELQAHGYLPIASDMRAVDHITYTPAPDIVHEAAGHAPILVDPEYASYLKAYAQVASKAIISREDIEQYEAIRILSDLKEDSDSTPAQVAEASQKLATVTESISYISEAAVLGRMNWWTAEYGLVGSLEEPKIFGAGLLSSFGEAHECLSAKVKKLPLTLECIDFAYDITEPQPQLFVTPDFHHLKVVLDELAETMAYRRGGQEGLEKAKRAASVNSAELNSGLQISGVLKNYLFGELQTEVIYLQFDGPVQLCEAGKQFADHGPNQHAQGFGSPIGLLEGKARCLSEMSSAELEGLGLKIGQVASLRYASGITVKGVLRSVTLGRNGKLQILTFANCLVKRDKNILFDPAWGVYDMAIGSSVVSVFGGPADRLAYGASSGEDFVAKVIPRKVWPPLMQEKHRLYAEVRSIRDETKKQRKSHLQTSGEEGSNSSWTGMSQLANRLESVLTELEENFPHDWLLRLEILELATVLPAEGWLARLRIELRNLAEKSEFVRDRIDDEMRVVSSGRHEL